MEVVYDPLEKVEDSVEVIDDLKEVAQHSMEENELQWLRDKPNIVRTMLKIWLPKFY